MKLSARVFSGGGKRRLFRFLLLLMLPLVFLSRPNIALAQNSYPPNTNADVPQNQHTHAQVVMIEIMAASLCQLTGIDVFNPEKGCLGVDPRTQKIGYTSSSQTNERQVGGLLGMSSQLVGSLYTPPASGITYLARLKDNFGIVKTAQAQQHSPQATSNSTGFDQLLPVQVIWEASRNLTYVFFVVIFIVIGLGIMLRLKIDPRTAMSIQNQLPRIIVAILMITFSYSIVGFMIDTMWLGTYVGINLLTDIRVNNGNEITTSDCEGNTYSLKNTAFSNILNFPLAFTNDIFNNESGDRDENGVCTGGLLELSREVGGSMGTIATSLIKSLTGPDDQYSCSITDPAACVRYGVANLIGFVASIFGFLVAVIAILVVMFRLWWVLLKAYAYVIIYTIAGPFWILLGLLPNSTLGISGWLRTLFAKLAVFPAAAFLIIVARIILESYSTASQLDPTESFVPPLVGNPSLAAFSPLLAFAILLIAPELLNMLNDALKAPSNKYTGPAVAKGFATGAAVPAALAGGMIARQFRFDPKTGQAGALAAYATRKFPALQRRLTSGARNYQRIVNPQNPPTP